MNILRILQPLCVIVTLKLKQKTTFSCFVYILHKLFNSLFEIDLSLRKLNDELLPNIFLYGPDKYKDHVHMKILLHTINFIETTKRFERLRLIDH